MAHQGCPLGIDLTETAIKRCPFLGQLALDHGESFARGAAHCQAAFKGPVLCESPADLQATFKLFHGATGIVPLADRNAKQCPFHHSQSESQLNVEGDSKRLLPSGSKEMRSPAHLRNPLHQSSAAPFASLSLSAFNFLPGPDEFIKRCRRRKQQRDLEKAQRQQQQRQNAQSKARHTGQLSGMEKWRTHPIIGGLIPLNAAGKYACPPLVVAGRAAVAQLRTTKALRPRKLPVKLLGVGGHCLAANIPCGMVREHTEKFSPAWVLAVHATVPYFGFLRKGVGMPKWAILLTLITAISGQAIGARLERKRIAWSSEGGMRSLKSVIRPDPSAGQTASKPPTTGPASRSQDSGSRCPLIKTCEEMARCDNIPPPMPTSNMVLSN